MVVDLTRRRLTGFKEYQRQHGRLQYALGSYAAHLAESPVLMKLITLMLAIRRASLVIPLAQSSSAGLYPMFPSVLDPFYCSIQYL